MSEIGARCCPAAFAKSSLTAIGPLADRLLLGAVTTKAAILLPTSIVDIRITKANTGNQR